MANWNSNDGFRNQRKRTFTYKSAAQRKPAQNTPKGDQNLTTVTSQSFSSPRKKIKSSYSYYDKTRSDREAAEELCSDLPADAFEDDLGVDFGDDLTVEELCEAACVAEQEMAHKDEKMNENVTRDEADGEGDYLNSLDQDILEEATRKHNVRPSATNIPAYNSGSVMDEIKYETTAHETSALLFSSPGCSTNRSVDAVIQRNLAGGSKTHVSNGCANGNTRLLEEITFIKSKLLESEQVIKKLEEDKFLMDGELKTLRDTLEHAQAVDAKQRERIRIIEEENRKTIDEKEKELKRQIEHLTTQLCFKDQEIAQAKEQMKRQIQIVSNENINLSPHRKKHPTLAESSVIPTGMSFFEKKPSDVQLSPKTKVPKVQKSPLKDKPEAVKHVLGSSSARNVSLNSREFETRSVKKEKHILDGNENELLQKLFKLENMGINSMSPEFEVCGVNQNILSLLNSSSRVGQMEQSRKEDGVDIQKLVKQEAYTPKKGIQLDLGTEPKDNRLHQSVYDNIQELLNAQPSNFSDKHEACLDLVSNCKVSNFLDLHQESFTVQGFLPLLEHHISQYIDLRLENDEESLSSTCSPGSPGEGGEMRQQADKDGSVSLLEALDLAVQSLRCLNILVLHSDGVCEMLLRSAKVFSSNENEVEEMVETSGRIQQSSSSNEEKSDLLNLVFKLTVPLQKEPQLVTQAALNVVSSLAQRCPSEYRTRYLPLLCDRLLPQCISRDSSVTIMSLVVPILMVVASIPSLIRCLCSQSDECLLLKVYQGCLRDTDDLSHHLIFEVIELIETIVSSRNDAIPLLLDSECHCSLELIKYLVLLLHKRMVFLGHFPPDTLKHNQETRDSFILLRRGMFLLANLLINSSRLLADLHVEVEQQYVNLIIGTARLYSAIKEEIPEVEGMLLQDLQDFEHIEDDEVQQDYDEDGIEDMDVDTSS